MITLLQTPPSLILLLLFASLAVFFYARRANVPRLKLPALIAAAIFVLCAIAPYFIETPAKTVERQTRELASAFNNQDWTKFSSLLAPNVSTTTGNAPVPIALSRDQLLLLAKATTAQYHPQNLSISGLHAEQLSDSTIRDNFNTTIQVESQPILNDWEFRWTKTNNQWLCTQITETTHRLDNLPTP